MLQQDQLCSLQTRWKQALGITQVQTLPAPKGSPNFHFAGFREGAEKPSYFVKVTKKPKSYEQETAAMKVLADYGFRHNSLVANGREGDLFWLAFSWLDCSDVETLTREELIEAGQLLGKLHQTTRGLEAPELRKVTLRGEFLRQVEKLKLINQELADGLIRRYEVLQRVAGVWDAFEKTHPQCLVQGDFGWRNLVRPQDGHLMLIDFEHAVVGSCWMDFSKAMERELKNPYVYDLFMEGYRAAIGPEIPDISDSYRWGLNLWQVAGIFNYTVLHGDQNGFLNFGMSILDSFDRRWSL